MNNKLSPQSSTFRIYIILFFGIIFFILNGHLMTLQGILISTTIVSGIVFAAKLLKHQDNPVIGMAIMTLVGYTSYLTIALGSGLQNIEQLADSSSRVQLIFQNPNFLANFLLVTSTSTLVFMQRSLKRYYSLSLFLFPLVGGALLFTGSRTALVIFIILLCYFGIQALIHKHKTIIWLLLLFLLLGLILFPIVISLNQATLISMTSPNLIKESEYFSKNATAYRNATITVQNNIPQTLSPSGYSVSLIQAKAPPSTTLFYLQSIKKSVMGEDYVASIYLRSDIYQQIRLSTQLSSVICDIRTDWSRCITPVGKGDNYAALQFRFETLNPNQSVEFYFAEPQLEIGTQATPYQPRAYPSRIYLLSKRLSQNIFSTENNSGSFLAGRPEAWNKGWNLFLQRPLLGVGNGNFTKYEDTEITHSHNIFIQILATQGLIGFTMWFAVGFIMLSSMTARQRCDFFPMLMVAFLMNLTDYTFIHASSLYVFFFTWGCVYFNKIYPEAENKELVSR